jgi:hypothetical protein
MRNRFSGAYEYQAFRMLQFAFVVMPIVAGLDKFFYFLTNWTNYLSESTINFLQGNQWNLMMAVGALEILVGIGVIFKPRQFSYVVVLWLLCLIIDVVILRKFYDVALRDFGLLIAALALSRLSRKYAS